MATGCGTQGGGATKLEGGGANYVLPLQNGGGGVERFLVILKVAKVQKVLR